MYSVMCRYDPIENEHLTDTKRNKIRLWFGGWCMGVCYTIILCFKRINKRKKKNKFWLFCVIPLCIFGYAKDSQREKTSQSF